MNVQQDKSGRGLPITRIETIAEGVVDGSRVGFAGLAEPDCREWLLASGDLLLSHINSVSHIGKCAIYNGTPVKLVHGMNLLCLRCDTARLLPRFATYLIRSDGFKAALLPSIKRAVNQASVSIADLRQVGVHLPPLGEQRRISDILDRADAMLAKRREAIALSSQLEQAAFIEMFGDPVSNPRRWPTRRLDAVADVVTGNTPPRANEENFGGHIEWIKSDNIDPRLPFVTSATEGLSAVGAKLGRVAPSGATLVTCIAGSPNSIGNAAMTDRPVAFNQQINAVIPVSADAEFLRGWLRTAKPLVQAASTNSMKGMVAKSKLQSLHVIVPPLELQRGFGAAALRIDSLTAAHRASLAEMDALFAALQHRAFRGEL